MILILSHPDDIHARAVTQHLVTGGIPFEILDLSQFPQNARLVMEFGTGGTGLRWQAGGQQMDLAQVRAAWWRRPQPFQFEAGLQSADFARSECDEVFAGLWQAIPAQWMNPPVQDLAGSRKSWQLALANDLGLAPPETLLTNCPDTAREFVARVGDVIYKPFAASLRYWRETRRFGAAELQNIGQLRHAPTILQERIAGRDIRVTVVGDQIFAAEIDASQGNYADDFRMNQDVQIRAIDLPIGLQDAIRALMGRMALVYGALDFRRDQATGAYRFLEINPAGQWLFIEEQTGQPIARAVADQLMKMARSRH
jgi:glutathione synthase/RimK-type ligase-like ATP-grasp enzyme